MARMWLAPSADATIRAEARTRRVVETGGPLFGYFDGKPHNCVAVVAGGPGPNACHRPFSFRADRDAIATAIRELHDRSVGVLSYIGEWHSHPGGSTAVSGRDLGALAALAEDGGVDVPEPVMVIVATVVLTRRVRVRTVAAYRWSAPRRIAERLDINVAVGVEMDLGSPADTPSE